MLQEQVTWSQPNLLVKTSLELPSNIHSQEHPVETIFFFLSNLNLTRGTVPRVNTADVEGLVKEEKIPRPLEKETSMSSWNQDKPGKEAELEAARYYVMSGVHVRKLTENIIRSWDINKAKMQLKKNGAVKIGLGPHSRRWRHWRRTCWEIWRDWYVSPRSFLGTTKIHKMMEVTTCTLKWGSSIIEKPNKSASDYEATWNWEKF